MDLFYGRRAAGTIERAGSGWLDGTAIVTMRVQPAASAPSGFARKTAWGPAWLLARHDGACRVTLTPVLDGVERSDLAETHDLELVDVMTDAVLRLTMTEPATWPGDATPFSRQALQASLATIRAELVPLEAAIINPAGNDNALLFVAKVPNGGAVTVRYVDPGAPSQALSIGVVGTAVTVNLATSVASAITSTAAQIKAAIAAHGAANALLEVTIRDDDGGAGSGAGVVTAIDVTPLEAGTIYGLGGFESGVRAVAVGGTAVGVSA